MLTTAVWSSAAVVPAILTSACATAPFSPNMESSEPLSVEQLAFNPFDRIDARPGVLLTARIEGTVRSSGGCIVLVTERGVVTPLWPEGTTLLIDGAQVAVVLPDGRGAAILGTRVELSGGAFSEADLPLLDQRVSGTCPNPYFSVSTANGDKR